jgi:hypothetical protein
MKPVPTPGREGDTHERLILTAQRLRYCGPACALETVDDRTHDGVRTVRVFCMEHGAKVAAWIPGAGQLVGVLLVLLFLGGCAWSGPRFDHGKIVIEQTPVRIPSSAVVVP